MLSIIKSLLHEYSGNMKIIPPEKLNFPWAKRGLNLHISFTIMQKIYNTCISIENVKICFSEQNKDIMKQYKAVVAKEICGRKEIIQYFLNCYKCHTNGKSFAKMRF